MYKIVSMFYTLRYQELTNKSNKMSINDLPNVEHFHIKDGYLTIKLVDGDWIRFNFNEIEKLKSILKQLK